MAKRQKKSEQNPEIAKEATEEKAELGNAQSEPLAVPPKPSQEAAKKTLTDACNEFLRSIDYVLYTRKKKLGDLLAIRKEIEGFMRINHPILKEPVE